MMVDEKSTAKAKRAHMAFVFYGEGSQMMMMKRSWLLHDTPDFVLAGVHLS